VGRRKEPCIGWDGYTADWRHMANTIERSVLGGEAWSVQKLQLIIFVSISGSARYKTFCMISYHIVFNPRAESVRR